MKRIALFALLHLALVAALPFAARAQSAIPALKAEAAVSGELVRIGDLLENAGAKASIPVFKAPALGAHGTIQVHRVTEACAPTASSSSIPGISRKCSSRVRAGA